MNCDCIEKVNAQLLPDYKLATGLIIEGVPNPTMRRSVALTTVKIDAKRRVPPAPELAVKFCPFCGKSALPMVTAVEDTEINSGNPE